MIPLSNTSRVWLQKFPTYSHNIKYQGMFHTMYNLNSLLETLQLSTKTIESYLQSLHLAFTGFLTTLVLNQGTSKQLLDNALWLLEVTNRTHPRKRAVFPMRARLFFMLAFSLRISLLGWIFMGTPLHMCLVEIQHTSACKMVMCPTEYMCSNRIDIEKSTNYTLTFDHYGNWTRYPI